MRDGIKRRYGNKKAASLDAALVFTDIDVYDNYETTIAERSLIGSLLHHSRSVPSTFNLPLMCFAVLMIRKFASTTSA
jgi:hypothetical protein